MGLRHPIHKQGTVIWGDDPFNNSTSDDRPWIIVSNDRVPPQNRLATPLTTKDHPDSMNVPDSVWVDGGLPGDSCANQWVLRPLPSNCLRTQAGRVTDSFVSEITDEFLGYIESGPNTFQQYSRGEIVTADYATHDGDAPSRWVVLNNDSRPFNEKYMCFQISSVSKSPLDIPIPGDGSIDEVSGEYISTVHPSPLWESDIIDTHGTLDSEILQSLHEKLRLSFD